MFGTFLRFVEKDAAMKSISGQRHVTFLNLPASVYTGEAGL